MAQIESALRGFLAADPGLAALVGQEISPLQESQGLGAPRVVYSLLSAVDTRTLDQGPDHLPRCRIRLGCWGTTYAQAKQVAAAVRGAVGPGATKLDGFRGSMGGVNVQAIFVEDRVDDLVPPTHAEEQGSPQELLDLLIWFDDV